MASKAPGMREHPVVGAMMGLLPSLSKMFTEYILHVSVSRLGWGHTKNEMDTVSLLKEPCTHEPRHLTTPGTQAVGEMGEVPQNHTWRGEWPEMSPVFALLGEIPVFRGRLG